MILLKNIKDRECASTFYGEGKVIEIFDKCVVEICSYPCREDCNANDHAGHRYHKNDKEPHPCHGHIMLCAVAGDENEREC